MNENKNKSNQQEKRDNDAQYNRTEFGMEFSGDMNAAMIYEILAGKNKKGENK